MFEILCEVLLLRPAFLLSVAGVGLLGFGLGRWRALIGRSVAIVTVSLRRPRPIPTLWGSTIPTV